MPTDASPALGAPDNWVAPLARAVPALVLGLVITFSQDHTASFGLLAFGIFAVFTAAVLLASGLRADRAIRGPVLTQGIVTAVAGIAALLVPSAEHGYVVLIVSGWALVTGALETVNGLRFRRVRAAARDWLLTGALTLALGLVFLLVPSGFAEDYSVEDGDRVISGVVTADVMLVGLLGAWAVLVGVQLAIATISLRSPRTAPQKAEA
ncbi:DUF308 domain-containing protein [Homoserinibacter sp. GY 40078]|uniref:DUF308 domain-containing protein n=1 Tax=Homoserinibacter sp. GY 40078 TaxID=2603275 RepID=UPI0011CCD2E0|nr:DUF308 domain-containing protein [Homoserinibacter sp. GY 40078]TXK18938.1 hypothetical protein FVQ89_03105 [Homoserinibacter sp. GY 40078]